MLMLQNLLKERFRLAAHYESRQIPVYGLVVGRDGPKMAPSVSSGGETRQVSLVTKGGISEITATAGSMQTFVAVLNPKVDRPIVDMTGLAGRYDFTLSWTPEGTTGIAADSGPTIFEALRDQLGLRLKSRRSPMQILVIDHVEKIPTEN